MSIRITYKGKNIFNLLGTPCLWDDGEHGTIMMILYSVIKKVGLKFLSLYFRIRTSEKYDVNFI